MIFWAGISSDDVRVVVERYPPRPLPRRQHETVSVPGRNGALYFDRGAYENYVQPYDVYISAEEPKLPNVARGVMDWLYRPGYQRLEDDYDRETYRMAYYAGPGEIENILNRFGRATIEFNCKPQRFLKHGEAELALSAAATIHNPTSFPAQPLITVYGSGAGALQVGDYTAEIKAMDGYIVLDSEVENAYKGTANQNGNVDIPYFPLLKQGANAISWSGGITGVTIKPRWWTI